jgi:hypothetical protein
MAILEFRVLGNFSLSRVFVVAAGAGLCIAQVLIAQENPAGPLTPPPEHHVTRIEGVPEPIAPPSIPPAEIIQGFSKKEELYLNSRVLYSYRKTIHIQEFGKDGRPSGEYIATYDAVRSADGKMYEKAISAPASTLEYLSFEPEDAQLLTRIPAYPVTASQLSKYDVKFLNTEKVDEVDCYIFQISPKTLDRQHALFDGVMWVDQKYLEVVKLYGKWVTDMGEMHPPTLPFGMFETYRENVDGKYWFPNYSRSDAQYKMKDREIPIRVTIKWTNFKPFLAVAATPSAPATPPATTAPSSTTPAAPATKPQ